MAKTIHLETKNEIGVDEAKRRISAGFERLRADYMDRIGSADLTWQDDVAHINVKAFAQEATAQITVTPVDLALDIQLPWLLAGFSSMIEAVIIARASIIRPG